MRLIMGQRGGREASISFDYGITDFGLTQGMENKMLLFYITFGMAKYKREGPRDSPDLKLAVPLILISPISF
jgi:hypothetical protein